MGGKSKRDIFHDEDALPLTYIVRLHVYADGDRAKIFDYINEASPANAALVEERISKALQSLQEDPFRSRQGVAEGTYERRVPKTKFFVIYIVRSPYVIVLRIMHGARQRPVRQLKHLAFAKSLTVVTHEGRRLKMEILP